MYATIYVYYFVLSCTPDMMYYMNVQFEMKIENTTDILLWRVATCIAVFKQFSSKQGH